MIAYRATADGVTADQLTGGFFVGWPNPPSPETHLRILQGSAYIVLAVDAGADRVVGFITAISDGVLAAFIPLLEVLPSYQGQGIGSELVRRLLVQLRDHYSVDLLCDPHVQPFYERLGMQRAHGMLLRYRSNQPGITRSS